VAAVVHVTLGLSLSYLKSVWSSAVHTQQFIAATTTHLLP